MLWVLKRTVSITVLLSTRKHMYKLIDKEINAILGTKNILIPTYVEYKINLSTKRYCTSPNDKFEQNNITADLITQPFMHPCK